ncbi:flavin reductase family protein [Streptomyces sp. NPDC048523]|uniref:flavin reductase family protein n=1 Tax=Streptomyces sp. NPDC048523 TaxID=3365567 RepID=UPI003719571A
MNASRRRSLRQLASAVSVLTVHHEGRVHGTTVSTAATVSHSPLLLAASLKANSILVGLAMAEGRFSVNVLSGRQADAARWFADGRRPDGEAQFASLPWRRDDYTAAPLLEGALGHYSCRVAGCAVVGDHEVLLGQVVRADSAEGEPLLSFAGDLFTAALEPPCSEPEANPLLRDEALAVQDTA